MGSTITIIAAIANNHIIGKNGKIPWHIPSEIQHFRETTLGSTVIMGRNTFETSIGGALKDRHNIVVSTTLPSTGSSHVTICRSFPEALTIAQSRKIPIFIIEGEQIYIQALPYADHMILSYIEEDWEGDAHFPPFSKKEWYITMKRLFPQFTLITYNRTPYGKKAQKHISS